MVEAGRPAMANARLSKVRGRQSGYFPVTGLALSPGTSLGGFRRRRRPPPGSSWSVSPCRKYFPRENPIGRRIARQPEWQGRSTIVGVVDDVPNLNLADAPERRCTSTIVRYSSRRSPPLWSAHSRRPTPMQVAAAVQKEIETNRARSAHERCQDDARKVIAGNISQPRF